MPEHHVPHFVHNNHSIEFIHLNTGIFLDKPVLDFKDHGVVVRFKVDGATLATKGLGLLTSIASHYKPHKVLHAEVLASDQKQPSYPYFRDMLQKQINEQNRAAVFNNKLSVFVNFDLNSYANITGITDSPILEAVIQFQTDVHVPAHHNANGYYSKI